MKYFSTEYVRRVVFGGEKLVLPEKAMQEVERCYRFLEEFHKDKVIYGINTGFGPMAQWRVEDDYLKDLFYWRRQAPWRRIRKGCHGCPHRHIPSGPLRCAS